MDNETHCFVIGCKHGVRILEPRPFCFIHSEIAKCIIGINHQYFEPPVDKKQLDLCLSQSDQDFILGHLDGCNSTELAEQIGNCTDDAISYNLRKGNINGEKRKITGHGKITVGWLIGSSEIIRVLDIYRNWITLYAISQQINESPRTLVDYALGKYFGSIKRDLGGAQCIHKSIEIKSIARIVKNNKKTARERAIRNGGLTIRGNMICAVDLARGIGFSEDAVINWIKNGWLQAKRQQNKYLLLEKDILDFLLAIKSGRFCVKKLTRQRLAHLTAGDIYKLFPKK